MSILQGSALRLRACGDSAQQRQSLQLIPPMRFRQQAPKSIMVILAGAMMLSAFIISMVTWKGLNATIAERTKLRSLFIKWEQLFSTIKDAETGQRGYIITGEEEFLKPFHDAAARLPAEFQTLGSLEDETKDGYGMEDVIAFQRLVDRKLEELRETITVNRREGREAATKLIQSRMGLRVMDEIRTEVGTRVTELKVRMDEHDSNMQRDLLLGSYSVAGTCVAALAAGAVALLLLRESERQARREERLAGEKRRAEDQNREKSVFLATMSHEIRTPMNAILGFGELLEAEAHHEKDKRYAQSIVRSGHSLLQIINDILDLSKVEAGMMELHAESMDLRELAAFVQQLFLTQTMNKGIELRVEMADDVPGSLMLDKTRLRQILINLVGNAFRFTEQGHVTLKIQGHREDGSRSRYHLVTEVIDTGVGIPAEKLQDIFKPFVQAESKRPAEALGTGLGLVIVKRLATLMGGTVLVQSEVGKGTTFRLDLPHIDISTRLPLSIHPEETNVNFNDLQPACILVTDDNPVNRELVRGFFAKTHHRIIEASNGREAMAAIAADRPDLVLMDIRMPVMDGREVLQLMRQCKDFDRTPVIAVTASSMAGEEGSLKETFDGYVRKPYTRAELYAELSNFIPRQKKHPSDFVLADDMARVAAPDSWPQLVIELSEMETTLWPAIKDRMVLSEVGGFARKLLSMAKDHHCAPLEAYASTLATQTDHFLLQDLEKSLESFPDLISQLKHRLTLS
jgi:signal transduction histidine kinase/CheY-like chemotaxis protein